MPLQVRMVGTHRTRVYLGVLGYGLREKPVPTRGCFQNHHSIIAGAVELSTPHPLVGCRAEPTLGEYWRSRRLSKVKAVEQRLSMERKSILWNGITFGSSVRRPKNRFHVLLCLDGSWRDAILYSTTKAGSPFEKIASTSTYRHAQNVA